MLGLNRCWLFAVAVAVVVVVGVPEARAQRVNRGPYLQSGTPTQVTVRWRTSSSTDSVVRFGTSQNNLNRTARVSGNRTEHTVVVNGLNPDTRYYYSVGSSSAPLSGGTSETYFETAPQVGSTGHTRIWAIGDSGTANSDAFRVYDAYQNYAAGNYTDVWVMLGDNAYDDGRDSEYQDAVFDMYPELLRQSVLWPTLGNHDGYTADSASESGPYYNIFTLPRRGEAGGVASGTEAYYSYDHANIHFIVLDSYETNRSPGGAMLRWLEAHLQATTADWLIAYWHHPPYTKGSHDSDSEGRLIDMREDVLPILEEYGVDLVLGGHSHSYERSFLLDGHYGRSSTLTGRMLVDGGDGRVDGDGAYDKPTEGLAPHEGAVYVVAGSSGKRSGGRLNHPAMFLSLNQLGSVVIDVDDLTLDAKFLNDSGRVTDYFTIVKGGDPGGCTGSGCGGGDTDIVTVAAVDDAFVTEGSPGTNYGNAGSLEIDTADTFKYSLIKPRNLGGIAPGSEVVSAELVLTVFDPGDTVEVREVLQAWNEGGVTFQNAPSAAGTAMATFPGSTGTVAVDITDIAQRWVNGAPVHGLQLWPTDSNGTDLRSSEYSTSSLRPFFVFEVRAGGDGGGDPCPDNDGDGAASSACGGNDCNDSNPAMRPGLTEICGDGLDNDCDGAADCSDGSCASAPVCTATARTVFLTNLSDTFVRQDQAGTNYGGNSALELDTAGVFKHTLIKPNGLGGIAAGAEVVSAELVVQVFNGGDTVSVREIRGPWSENSVTWNSAPSLGGQFATMSGAPGERSVDVTALVQSWVNGAPIYGLDLYPTGSDGVDMRSTEYGTSSDRPYFVVEVIEGSAPTCRDNDGDGFEDAACGGNDCNDSSAAINPGAAEVCGDGVDNNCDGSAPACPGNQPPQLSFAQPSATPGTSSLGVVLNASDADGRVTQIDLFIGGQFVRRERAAPYEWGTANSNQSDSALLNLAPGSYELRAVATDDRGASTTATRTVRIEGDEPPPPEACDDQLLRNERLLPGEFLCSANGDFQFGLISDGKLTLRAGNAVLWTADARSGTGARLNMQGDGNLVIYNASGQPLWASGTAGQSGATLRLENSGRAVVSLGGRVLWSVGGSEPPPPQPGGEITHVGTTEIWDSNGQNIVVDQVPGVRAGDLLVLAMHRTDDDLPLTIDGWTRVAECYKSGNGNECAIGSDCTRWENSRICRQFGSKGNGHDLAQAIFVRTARASEPGSYRFNLNADSSGAPGWAILIALRGADTNNPVHDWAFRGCDGSADSVFPSVRGERGDMVLLSQSFDDAIAQSRFRAPSGLRTFGYVSNSDEAGFLFGGLLTRTGETGTMRTGGDGGPSCKDGLVSLTIRPAR